MQSNIVTPIADTINYDEAEQHFINLLDLENLDSKLESQPELASIVDKAIATISCC